MPLNWVPQFGRGSTYTDAIQVQACRIMSGKRLDAVETLQFQDVRLSILANA